MQYETVLTALLNSPHRTPCRQGGFQNVLPQGVHMAYDMSNGFPLITTKKIQFKSVWAELEWMLSGERSVNRIMIEKHGVKFWQPWQLDKSGDMGPIYGVQFRNWNGDNIDQIKNAQDELKSNPHSRRILISAWNPTDIPDMALPPCHFSHQYATDGRRLNLHFNMRSWDFFIGAGFNIAFYSLMLHLMAKTVDLCPGLVVAHGSHVHLYDEHIHLAEEQVQRVVYTFPEIEILNKKDNIWEYEIEDVVLKDYRCHKGMKAHIHV